MSSVRLNDSSTNDFVKLTLHNRALVFRIFLQYLFQLLKLGKIEPFVKKAMQAPSMSALHRAIENLQALVSFLITL